MYSLYTWGKGKSGTLGHGDGKDRAQPTLVQGLKPQGRNATVGSALKCISLGPNHSAAIVGKDVYVWGDSTHGQLGRGMNRQQLIPTKIFWQRTAVSIACGFSHTLLLTDKGQIFGMGDNEVGQIGVGTTEPTFLPLLIESLQHIKVVFIAAGNGVSAAITHQGDLYTWGRGENGQLANGQRSSIITKPLLVAPIVEVGTSSNAIWVQVQFGIHHTMGRTKEGTVFSWGSNRQGQLGIGPNKSASLTPTRVQVGRGINGGDPDGVRMVDIDCGGYHSGAIGEDGRVYIWGANNYGQSGNGTSLEQTPTLVLGPLRDKTAIGIALGYFHSVVLTAEGEVYTFGHGEFNQLGLGDKKGRSVPTLLNEIPGVVSSISAAGDGCCVLVEERNSNTNGIDQNLYETIYTKGLKEENVQFKLLVTTWNCNGKRPETLSEWLLDTPFEPDIIVIGIQEMVKMAAGSVVYAQASQGAGTEDSLPWVTDIDRYLGPLRYVKVLCKVMVGVLLSVYVKEDHRPAVRNIQNALAPCGVMGKIGNKGAVAIRFSLYDSQFCFVCSHLAAGPSKERLEKRYQDFRNICHKVHFTGSNNSSIPNAGTETTIFDHDFLFWCGDLNYRIDLPDSTIKKLVEEQKWEQLQERDQLTQEKQAGRIFMGFSEIPLNFAPTYKYDCGTQTYDTGEKQRSPAWCDRILWRGEDVVVPISYRRHELLQSDHRPVSAQFYVHVKRTVKDPTDTLIPTQPTYNLPSFSLTNLNSSFSFANSKSMSSPSSSLPNSPQSSRPPSPNTFSRPPSPPSFPQTHQNINSPQTSSILQNHTTPNSSPHTNQNHNHNNHLQNHTNHTNNLNHNHQSSIANNSHHSTSEPENPTTSSPPSYPPPRSLENQINRPPSIQINGDNTPHHDNNNNNSNNNNNDRVINSISIHSSFASFPPNLLPVQRPNNQIIKHVETENKQNSTSLNKAIPTTEDSLLEKATQNPDPKQIPTFLSEIAQTSSGRPLSGRATISYLPQVPLIPQRPHSKTSFTSSPSTLNAARPLPIPPQRQDKDKEPTTQPTPSTPTVNTTSNTNPSNISNTSNTSNKDIRSPTLSSTNSPTPTPTPTPTNTLRDAQPTENTKATIVFTTPQSPTGSNTQTTTITTTTTTLTTISPTPTLTPSTTPNDHNSSQPTTHIFSSNPPSYLPPRARPISVNMNFKSTAASTSSPSLIIRPPTPSQPQPQLQPVPTNTSNTTTFTSAHKPAVLTSPPRAPPSKVLPTPPTAKATIPIHIPETQSSMTPTSAPVSPPTSTQTFFTLRKERSTINFLEKPLPNLPPTTPQTGSFVPTTPSISSRPTPADYIQTSRSLSSKPRTSVIGTRGSVRSPEMEHLGNFQTPPRTTLPTTISPTLSTQARPSPLPASSYQPYNRNHGPERNETSPALLSSHRGQHTSHPPT